MFRTLLRRVLPALALVCGTHALAATAIDPTTTGSFGAASTEYRFPAKVDAKVTDKAVTEIWAKVWFPTKPVSSAPIVVLLHGNHGTCGHAVKASDGNTYRIDDRTDYSTTGKCPAGYVVTPNHTGYDYVASRLASNGFVVLSINANRGITAAPESSQENDPGLILRRGRMILRHLELLGQWNRGQIQLGHLPASLRGKLNFSKITVFGHSRGGDGIVAAYNLLKTSVWRQRLPAGSKIVAVASMAPTDFQTSHPSVLGAALGVLLPMCDSDVVRLSGLGFYDRSVLSGKDTAGNFKSVLEVWRTNHNGYNTQWQTDDTYQAPSHTCPGQGSPLFKFRIGLSAQQQAIGRYFLMGLARARSQNANFGQLFNPAYTPPAGLRSLTRIDRGYFVGTSAAARQLVRFNGTCGQKLLVSANVAGTCLAPPPNPNGAPAEHDVSTSAARVRWNRTGQTTNLALFVLNNGTPASLAGFKTLDMRVGPDCFLEISQSFKGCTDVSPTGGSENWANIRIYLQDSQNHLSRAVAPASYLAAPQTIAVSVPPDAKGPWIPRSPLGHAILRSLRIPISAFQQTGFNLASVKYIRVTLGSATSRGGLYFGDAWAVGAASNALAMEPESAVADLENGDMPTILAQATGFSSPADLPFVSAAGNSAADTTIALPAAEATTLATSPAPSSGNRIVSVRRGSLPSQPAGLTSESPDAAATSTLATVEFTLATSQPLTDTSDSGFRVVIGETEVQARYFETGLEAGTPSIAKLVVPASAVDAAPNGASITVKNAADTWTFGTLNKESIR